MGHTHSNVSAVVPEHSHTYSDKYLDDDNDNASYDNKESDHLDGSYKYEPRSTDPYPAVAAPVTFGSSTDISPNVTGGGGERGLNGEGHGHTTTKSGGVTLSDTTHQHNMNFTIPTLPPYYALAFIYKL